MSRMEMATFLLWLVFDGRCHFIVFGFLTSHPVFLASDMLLMHNLKKKSLKDVWTCIWLLLRTVWWKLLISRNEMLFDTLVVTSDCYNNKTCEPILIILVQREVCAVYCDIKKKKNLDGKKYHCDSFWKVTFILHCFGLLWGLCLCVCVCVCERGRERERERESFIFGWWCHSQLFKFTSVYVIMT